MSILSKWLSKQVDKELIKKGFQNTNEKYNGQIYQGIGSLSNGNIIWNPEADANYIKEGYQGNVTVYAIIQLIIKHASAVPFNVYEVKNERSLKQYKAMTSGMVTPESIINSRILKARTLTDIEDTDLENLLNRPNPAQSYASWISELIAFGRLTGDRFIYKIGADTGSNVGKAKELYVLPSQSIDIVSGGLHLPVKGYTLDYNGALNEIPADDVCHIKDFNPDYNGQGSHLYGQSPLKAAYRNLQINNEAISTGLNMLENQTTRGILTAEDGDIDQVQAQALKDSLKAEFAANQGGVTITPTKLSWVNFGLSTTDMGLLEQYGISVDDLCNAYSVNSLLLNSRAASTESNVKEARKSLYQNAIIPELIKIRDELNRFLVPDGKLFIDFDFSSIPELQVDLEKQAQVLANSNWLTQNEKRMAMNYAKDEDNKMMDDYLIPQGNIPLSDLDLTGLE
tara:strand:+ start:535 stop:1899 length:1365 start_codon:yes stop_codon:yes gene_type:complete